MVKTARMIPTETELQEIYEEIYWNNKHNNAVELIAIPEQPLCPELDTKDLSRLMLLLTYCGEDRVVAAPGMNRYATKKDVLFLLGGGSKTEAEALNRLISLEKVLVIDGKYYVMALDSEAYRHPRKQRSYFLRKSVFQSTYIANKELFGEKIHPKVLLGHMLRLIPYLNETYNILCENQKETRLKDIVPLTEEDICKISGARYRGASRHIDEALFTITTIEGNYELIRPCQTEYGKAVFVMNPEFCQMSETHWSISSLRNCWKWYPVVYDVDFIEPINEEEERMNACDAAYIQKDFAFWNDK